MICNFNKEVASYTKSLSVTFSLKTIRRKIVVATIVTTRNSAKIYTRSGMAADQRSAISSINREC